LDFLGVTDREVTNHTKQEDGNRKIQDEQRRMSSLIRQDKVTDHHEEGEDRGNKT
jgi:hypothetical protein